MSFMAAAVMQVPCEMDTAELAGMLDVPRQIPADLLHHFARDLCMRRQVFG